MTFQAGQRVLRYPFRLGLRQASRRERGKEQLAVFRIVGFITFDNLGINIQGNFVDARSSWKPQAYLLTGREDGFNRLIFLVHAH